VKRGYQTTIVLFVILSASLVLVLRGSVPQKNATQVDGASYLESVKGSTVGLPVWTDSLSGQTTWQLFQPNSGTNASLTFKDGSLNLTAFFSQASQSEAVNVYRRPINVSLNDNPIAIVTVSVSRGIHYGIRFSGEDHTGSEFQAWYETSSLQHRPGQGSNETLDAYPFADAYTANGQFPAQNSTLTSVELYMEAAPGQTGWFSLVLSKIEMRPMLLKSYVDGEPYNGLIVPLSQGFDLANPSNQSLFQVYVGYTIQGTADLQYRPYLNRGLNALAEGFVYHGKAILDYEVADLNPVLVQDFPHVYSNSNNTYISIVALQGSITHFKIDTLLFDYLSQSMTQSGAVDPFLSQSLIVYYMAFLFVTPVTMIILLTKSFKNENQNTDSS
jgi:hypothetical protein